MPAKSKEQQRLFGMVHAYQKGELKDASEEVKDIAKTISKKDAKDFAETKHKGLPNKVEKSVKETIKINESQLRKIIAESVRKVLKEGIGRNKYESEFRNAINIITSHVDCETPKIGRDKNGYSYCDIEFPSISMSLRLYCYNESTGELGARLDDEYGTNMYDYVSAARGAPLGYIIDRTGKGLAQKIISDIQQIEKSSGEY